MADGKKIRQKKKKKKKEDKTRQDKTAVFSSLVPDCLLTGKACRSQESSSGPLRRRAPMGTLPSRSRGYPEYYLRIILLDVRRCLTSAPRRLGLGLSACLAA
jgi:hypothetical protein